MPSPDKRDYRNVARELDWPNSHIPIILFIRWDEKAGLRWDAIDAATSKRMSAKILEVSE